MESPEITMKERVLRFVESRGTARYTDIIRFIVDTKFGEGTYESGYQMEDLWVASNGSWKTVKRRKNMYRGYYSAAFSWNGYFFKGKDQLAHLATGGYRVIRNAKR
jgi:hypothetical protein